MAFERKIRSGNNSKKISKLEVTFPSVHWV
jgi:hypothetical protein